MQIIARASLVSGTLLALIVGATVALLGWRAGAGVWPGAVVAAFMLWRTFRQPLARWRTVRQAFPAESRAWLQSHVPFYAHLDPPAQARFERDVQLFLAEQRFEAVEGVTLTDELRLGVAAGAALMLHGRPTWEFSTRRSFLFYPGTFDADYFDDPEQGEFDGMAHHQGPVILSARAVQEDWAYADGNNVVLHELAHLLDFSTDGVDGAPSLMDPASADAWHRLVQRETQRVKLGRSLLRRYAATNAAEFFAVATEVFFERPDTLARRHPELFDALAAFYALDPRMGLSLDEGGEDDPLTETKSSLDNLPS